MTQTELISRIPSQLLYKMYFIISKWPQFPCIIIHYAPFTLKVRQSPSGPLSSWWHLLGWRRVQSFKRRLVKISQSWRIPLLRPSPVWKRLLALSHLRHYASVLWDYKNFAECLLRDLKYTAAARRGTKQRSALCWWWHAGAGEIMLILNTSVVLVQASTAREILVFAKLLQPNMWILIKMFWFPGSCPHYEKRLDTFLLQFLFQSQHWQWE